MSRRTRLTIIGLALLALLLALILFAFASMACPGDMPEVPCPGAATNRAVVIGLAALTVGTLVVPFALLAEFAVRGRILYRGAWGRAIRRGVLAAGAVAALGGLRLGGALTVPVTIFVLLLAGAIEWLAIRRFDSS